MILHLMIDTDDPAHRTLLHSWLRIAPDHPSVVEIRAAMFAQPDPPAEREEEE